MQKLPVPFNHLVQATRTPTALAADHRHSRAWHQWSDPERAAVVQAWASGRPLLVRGEAGCGKSQLARAVAKVLHVPLITEVIHPRFEATDLLYREDPVARLAQAQLLAAIKPEFKAGEDAKAWLKTQLNPNDFLQHGPIWRAMKEPVASIAGHDHTDWPRAVVLIDEIDKADSDIPNALLDVLGNRSFHVPATGEDISCDDAQRPLIIITTNEDRELPPAFVRRCAVLNLQPDAGDEKAFTEWLLQRARAHEALKGLGAGADSPMRRAAAQVWADRSAAAALNLPTVGLAEYLDLLYSLQRLSGGDAERARELLDQVSAFALVKQRELPQSRTAVASKAQSD
jgi:MoxR-like ATPase